MQGKGGRLICGLGENAQKGQMLEYIVPFVFGRKRSSELCYINKIEWRRKNEESSFDYRDDSGFFLWPHC